MSTSLLDQLDPESRALVYQSIQSLSTLVAPESVALVYAKNSPHGKGSELLPHPIPKLNDQEPWHLVIRITGEALQIEAEGENLDFVSALKQAEERMRSALIEINSETESASERSQKVDLMANESYRFNLH